MTERHISDLELSLLSLVSERACYGEELERVIAARGLRDWLAIGSASLYGVLAALEKQGLIARQTIPPDGDPAQTAYAITDAGCGVLHTAVMERLREPAPMATGFALGLANLHTLKPAQVTRALHHYRALIISRISLAETQSANRIADPSDAGEAQRALYAHAIAMMQAELVWINAFLADWSARHPADAAQPHDTVISSSTHSVPTQIGAGTVNRAKQIQRIKRPIS